MMPTYARLNPHGVPEIISTQPGEGLIECPDGIDHTCMCPTGEWEDRPAVEVRQVGAKLILTNIPPGSRLEIVDIEASAIIVDMVIDGDDTLSFPEAGAYQIDVAPPMPWLGWQGVLQC